MEVNQLNYDRLADVITDKIGHLECYCKTVVAKTTTSTQIMKIHSFLISAIGGKFPNEIIQWDECGIQSRAIVVGDIVRRDRIINIATAVKANRAASLQHNASCTLG